ncbi:hypothetical protein LCGC14_1714400 [marine sediment metagenome]|uniref:Uncharacterized protein n=1 Tax=marine sediment metagenome TaxID=412755 RepID=A0A0F9HES8_9ZZZZ
MSYKIRIESAYIAEESHVHGVAECERIENPITETEAYSFGCDLGELVLYSPLQLIDETDQAWHRLLRGFLVSARDHPSVDAELESKLKSVINQLHESHAD